MLLQFCINIYTGEGYPEEMVEDMPNIGKWNYS
jgi:hypothetical protein